jgi:hypothetical protein
MAGPQTNDVTRLIEGRTEPEIVSEVQKQGVETVLGQVFSLRIVGGELDGRQAFMSGRVRLSGDVLLAQAMRGWFNRQPSLVIV